MNNTNSIEWCDNIKWYISIYSYITRVIYSQLKNYWLKTRFSERTYHVISDILRFYYENQTIFIETKYSYLPITSAALRNAIDLCIQFLEVNVQFRLDILSD